MVIVNPATKGCGKKESTVLECAVKTGDFDNSMQPLAVSMTALLGPESHGKITLIVTENNDGNMIGAASVDPKYYECDNFINIGIFERYPAIDIRLSYLYFHYVRGFTDRIAILFQDIYHYNVHIGICGSV